MKKLLAKANPANHCTRRLVRLPPFPVRHHRTKIVDVTNGNEIWIDFSTATSFLREYYVSCIRESQRNIEGSR
jgi:hypothetical protein